MTDPAVVALVRTVADLLTRWADAHTRPPEPPPHTSPGDPLLPKD